MNAPLDEEYLTWLYSQVASTRLKTMRRTYWSLFRQLYTTQFVWTVPNDDNRVEDGKELRYNFMEDCRYDYVDPEWMGLECSMLELLIGLARRLSFEGEGEPRVWFWEMLDNVDLGSYTDQAWLRGDCEREVGHILNRVIHRTYQPDGTGGLFPLQYPMRDLRNAELWYQLESYLEERL